MESKKISFGFSKIQKKSSVQTVEKGEHKIELVKCLDRQSIKLVNEKLIEPIKQLVIPMKESTKTASAIASLKARQNVLNGIVESELIENKLPQIKLENTITETLEEKATRELLEAINKKEDETEQNFSLTVVPKADQLPLNGAQESNIDDYESIPVSQFGLAMLRGMGWKEIPKTKNDEKDFLDPIVRPKGMGLGADKIAKHKPALIPPEPNEVLEIRKNACVRILAGKNKDLYGQIEGFDDHAGRVIIKLALGGGYESLNEFMVQPVSKKEYAQYGKVINSVKYEEYKKLENEHGQIILKNAKDEKQMDRKDDEYNKRNIKYNINDSEAKGSRCESGDESEYHRASNVKRERLHDRIQRDEFRKHRHRSNSASSKSSEHRSKKKTIKSKKNKSRDRSRQKYSSSEDERRHKKKTKKSKRPRSRSRGRR